MNRVYLLLAAGLLGSGCVTSDVCDAHTVWVGWPDFVVARTGGGYETTTSCSGIYRMDVYVDDDPNPWSAYCTDNEVPVSVLTGTHTFTVEAVDDHNYPILRDQVDVAISDSCADHAVDTRPGEGWVTVGYDFGGGGCYASPSYIWFNVHDDIADVDIAGANASANSTAYVCNATSLPAFPLPAGSYTLDWMEEVYASGGFHAAGAYCSPTGFAVSSGHDTLVGSIPLADTTSFCPGTAP